MAWTRNKVWMSTLFFDVTVAMPQPFEMKLHHGFFFSGKIPPRVFVCPSRNRHVKRCQQGGHWFQKKAVNYTFILWGCRSHGGIYLRRMIGEVMAWTSNKTWSLAPFFKVTLDWCLFHNVSSLMIVASITFQPYHSTTMPPMSAIEVTKSDVGKLELYNVCPSSNRYNNLMKIGL